jgi:hypothetical protein
MENTYTINEWFKKNTKLKTISDLKILRNYLNDVDKKYIKEKYIRFSNDFEFKYYEYNKPSNINNVRPESIFKLNWFYIIKKIKKLFENDNINIKINYECPGKIETQLKQDNKMCYQHDVYITIFNNNTSFDCALEYFEKGSHNIKIDNDKEICSSQYVNIYSVYYEKDDLYNYMKDIIHQILILICTAIDDPYKLAKINFFSNHNNKATLKKDTELFNKIISFKKNNKFHFESFFNTLNPKNEETGEFFELEDFIEFLEDTYNIKIILDKDGFCSYKLFSKLIISLDQQVNSPDILGYKKIYQDAMDILFDSQQQIIDFVKKFNDRRENLISFVNFFLLNHIHQYANKTTLNIIKRKLN